MKVTAGASYIAVTAIFNSTEIQPVRKICSSNLNQTENLFDVLNALFDGSCLVNEIDFYIYVRKKSKRQIKCFEYITYHKIMYLFCPVASH